MKKHFFNFQIATFLWLTCCSIAHAQTPAEELSTLLNSIHTMRATITQTVYDNHGKAIQQSFGRMALQRPGKFRWEITKPIPQIVIANGSRLWIYDPDLEQVTIRGLQRAAGDTPALLLSHNDNNIEKDFTVKSVPKSSPDSRWFMLVPKDNDNMFASVQMGFLKNEINEMRLQDHLGHITRIQFKNAQMNASLAPSLFNFKPPANVDVIDETRKR